MQPYEQQHESERRKYEAAKAKYFETVTPEELAAENAWRRATNKRRAAKPTKRPRAHLKLLSKPSATKRPLTPFFVFAAAERERLASAGEGVKSVPLFAKEMGQRWRAMSESEKAVRRDAAPAQADGAGFQALRSLNRSSVCAIPVRNHMRLLCSVPATDAATRSTAL